MTITQLLSSSSSRSPSASSDFGSDEKAPVRRLSSLRPVSVDALRLIELTERTSAVMMSAESDYVLQTDPLVSVFRTFGALNRVPVKANISVVNYDEFSDSVARHVEQSSSQMLMVPLKVTGDSHTASSTGFNPFDHLFKRTITTDRSTEMVNSHYIRKVFAGTKADVCLVIDRGLSASGTPDDHHIFLPFFGGPDDRLALSLVVQLCAGDYGVTASVVRIKKATRTEFSEKIEDFGTNAHNVRVLHRERLQTLTTTIISRLYSLIRFTATNLLRPTSHPPLPTTWSGVDTPPLSRIQLSARLRVGSGSAKRSPISHSNLSRLSPRDCIRGGYLSSWEGRGGWRLRAMRQS